MAASPRILVVTEDVTERHRTQQLLANSERRFRAADEKNLACDLRWTFKGARSYVSPSTIRGARVAPGEEIVGRDFTSLLHPEDLQSVLGRQEHAGRDAGEAMR